jgi:hypothetical protein
MQNIKYAKHNSVRFKSIESRKKGTRMFIEFFDGIRKERIGKEMRGHIILNSTSNMQESIVLTFWKTKEDMDNFYSLKNIALADLVERAAALFEEMPERTDYVVSELSFMKFESRQ